MKDERKTKAQLIQEVGRLRRQIAEQQEHQAWQESERHMRAERDQAQRYLDVVDVIILALDAEGNVTLINRKGAEVLGYLEAEILGKNWVEHFLPAHLRSEVQRIFDRLLAGEVEPVEYHENPCLTKRGEERIIAWHNTLITDEAGHIVGILSSGEDVTERRQAEQALKRNEATLRGILCAAPVGIGLVWPGRILGWINEKLAQMTGYTEVEMEGQVSRMLYPSQDEFEQVGWEKYAQIREHGTGSVETHWKRKDGSVIDVLLSSTAIDPEDAAAGVVFTALDITEGKAAESQRDAMLAALQESEEKYRQLFELESDAILLIDNETGRILEGNAAASDLYGYSREELLDKRNTDLSAEPDQTRQATREKRTWVPVRFHRKKDDTIFPVEITARHFSWRGRQVHIAAVRDITQRVLAEEGLRRRNRELAMLNQIIAASASGLEMEAVLETACRELALTFGVPGAIAVLHNEEQTSALVVAEHGGDGWLPGLNTAIPIEGNPVLQDLIAHKMPLLVGNAQGQAPQPALLESLRQSGISTLLMLPLVVEGAVAGSLCLGASEPRHFSAEEVSLAWNVAGQVAGVLAQVRLNQQRRQLEAQYHQSQKMEAVGQLTAGIAHEFNNLLTAINGYAELVQLQLMPGDPLRDMVERVQNSGRRAAGLVRQLLAFSRRQVMEPRVVSLNGVVSDMGRMLQRIIGENIELATVLAPDVWPVKVDPAQIEQVIVNLAINARDAMPAGGRLCIETANVVLDKGFATSLLDVQPGDYVLLMVSDTGVGMGEQTRAHLFEPFFTTKDVGQGTGLGLSVVYGVVKQSGGHIGVHSEEGAGTTFKIYLPRAGEVLQPAAPRWGMVDIPVGQETILLVETDESVRDLARRLLRGQGYTVLEARSGQEALLVSAHHSGPIHLLLTDMVMPGLSGQALADELALARPELKVLFSSGYADLGIGQQGVLEPGISFLRKPFSPMMLALRVRQVLDQ